MRPAVEHIMTFIKVVEKGSFSAAAIELRVTKSVVSKHITALEEALKSQLLKRTTRKLIITEAGWAFYNEVKNIPHEINNAQQILQPFYDHPHGQLKVVSAVNFADALKMDVIPDFLLANTEITMQLKTVGDTRDFINEEFDIIILWKFTHFNFPDYNLVGKKIVTMPVGMYATPGYLRKHGIPKKPEDLVKHNCFSSIGNKWPFRKKAQHTYYIDISGNLSTDNDAVIHGATIKGLGIAYSYPFLFNKEILDGTVMTILSEYTQFTIDIYAFYHPTSYLPMKSRAFIDAMSSYYQAIQEEVMARGKL